MEYEHWCNLSDADLASRDIAEVNLLAAQGLPGGTEFDIAADVRKVDEWANIVAAGQRRLWKRRERGDCSDLTDNQFRMLVMVTILQRDLGVQYNPLCMTGEYDARNASNNFIHGPLSGHGGTCASLPFLYVAIGRRIGFPLFVVPAKEHLFVRWEGDGERFNIEATSLGFEPRDDLHYRTSPKPLSDAELKTCPTFLRNMTPREELACCLAERSNVLFDNLNIAAAVKAMYFANRLSSFYLGRWLVLLMALEIVRRMGGMVNRLPWEELVQVCAPRPRTADQQWAIAHAQRELLRQVTIRHSPSTETQDEFFSHLDKEPNHV